MSLREVRRAADTDATMRRLALLITATALVSQAGLAHAGATTGAEIVSYLNQQRAASKIPAAIKPDAHWSAACAAHNHYEELNGALTHNELTSGQGYTADSAFAALHGVIYQGLPWTATQNPFESAPIHLAQVLAPRLDSAGAAESGGFGCFTSLISRKRPAPKAKKIYTYPRNGATGWRTSEIAAEGPYTPGQRRGIPAGTTTGPYLLAMFDGPSLGVFSEAKVVSASVRGPAGPVKIRTADNRTSGLAGYLPTGAYLIVRKPLAPHTTYTAKVSAKIVGSKLKFSHTWKFTTGG